MNPESPVGLGRENRSVPSPTPRRRNVMCPEDLQGSTSTVVSGGGSLTRDLSFLLFGVSVRRNTGSLLPVFFSNNGDPFSIPRESRHLGYSYRLVRKESGRSQFGEDPGRRQGYYTSWVSHVDPCSPVRRLTRLDRRTHTDTRTQYTHSYSHTRQTLRH